MAIHMALYGGLGIIHCNNTIDGAPRPQNPAKDVKSIELNRMPVHVEH